MRAAITTYVNDSRPAALPLALRRPSQFPRSASAWYHVPGIWVGDQMNRHRLDPVRSYLLGGLGLELRQLQNRDLGRLVHLPELYRIAV
jgi:hypothetical protein